MYVHEVIEAIEKNKIIPKGLGSTLSDAKFIRGAMKYHFGEASNLGKLHKSKKLFDWVNRGFPYNHMWVDMYFRSENIKIGIILLSATKTVALAKCFVYFTDYKVWSQSGSIILILLGGPTEANISVLHKISPDRDFSNWDPDANVMISQIKQGSTRDKTWLDIEHTAVSMLDTCLTLLSCKNIIQETIKPPAKLNKKRIKSNKPPIYEYRVLRMVVPRSVKQSNSDTTAKGLYTLPVHVCIGHEKTYTAERPLFGKHVGTYWWEPQERGNKKNGIIEKEYNIETRI